MDLLIKNGTIVTATEMFKADVAVKDGKIAAIGANLNYDGAKTVDAEGMLVLPGAIDAHTHLAMSFGGTVSSDDYFAGTRAAACGGTTRISLIKCLALLLSTTAQTIPISQQRFVYIFRTAEALCRPPKF